MTITRVRNSRIARIGHRIARGSVVSAEEFTTNFGVGGFPGSLDDYQWALGDIESSCVFDWRGGDGETPTIGSALTKVGVGVTSAPSPLFMPDGTNIPASYFAGDTHFEGTQNVFPGAGVDFIGLFVGCTNDTVSSGYMFSAADAVATYYLNSYFSTYFRVRVADGASITFTSAVSKGYFICLFYTDHVGNSMNIYTNSSSGSSQPAKSLVGGTRANVGTLYTGATTLRYTGYIARIALFSGAGIGSVFTQALAYRLTASVFGMIPNKPRDVSHDRSGILISAASSGVFPIAENAPVIHKDNGCYIPTTCTNKAYKNIGIAAGESSILTATGGMTLSDVAVDLSAYGIYGFGTRVFQAVNSTGSTQYVYYGAVCGALSTFHVSVRAHHTAGSGARVGVWCATGYINAATISDNFVRSQGTLTTTTANKRWAIEVPNGATVQFILANFVDQAYRAPEIANMATAAAAVLGATVIGHGYALEDAKGQTEVSLAPVGWSGSAEGGTRTIVTDSVSSGLHLRINNATQNVQIYDGTNTASAAIAESDGVYQVVRSSWGSKGLRAQVGAISGTASYDGAIGAGTAQTKGCNRRVRYVTMRKVQI